MAANAGILDRAESRKSQTDFTVLKRYKTGTEMDDRERSGVKFPSGALPLCGKRDDSCVFEDMVGSSEPMSRVVQQII